MQYTFAQEHLRDHLEQIRWMVLRYMRRHSDRLVGGDENYSNTMLGRGEFRRLARLERATQAGQRWLDREGVPSLNQLNYELAQRLHLMNQRLESTRSSHDASQRLPVDMLQTAFSLSDLELRLLIAAAAPHLDHELERLYRFAWADASLQQPTVAFIAEVVAANPDQVEAAIAALAESNPLQRNGLIDLLSHPRWGVGTSLRHAVLSVPQRVVDALQGYNDPAMLPRGYHLHPPAAPAAPPIVHADVSAELDALWHVPHARFNLVGARYSGRRTLMLARCAAHQQPLLELNLRDIFDPLDATGHVTPRLVNVLRECRLRNAWLLLRGDDLDAEVILLMERWSARLHDLLKAYPLGIALTSTEVMPAFRTLFEPLRPISFTMPEQDDQEELWRRALRPHLEQARADEIAGDIPHLYQLPPGAIFHAVDNTLETCHRDEDKASTLSIENLLEAVQQRLTHNLGWLADLISVKVSLEHVVMTDKAREQIEEVLRYARFSDVVFRRWGFRERNHGGQGLSVLFSGPPGTGKTLMAGALAKALGRPLYRIDLSRVVDKYIGETEKNLAKIFDEGSRAQAILLFDEADSLFAKRTEVRSSNDRHANLEVNFLLQRLESYDGVSILTTNFVQSLDEALQRRIRFKISFPMPDEDMRAMLWKTLIPPAAPLEEEIAWSELGDAFELSGGHIRNAVLRAALEAASADAEISEEMLWRSAEEECREMGMLVPGGRGLL